MESIVVIGNGMVGYKFCEKLIDEVGFDKYKVTIFGEEPLPAYNRVKLSAYLDDHSLGDLILASEEWYIKNKINLILNDRISFVDGEKKVVQSIKGFQVKYDKLVFATGSAPFVPPINGIEKRGVFVYRTISDLDDITAYAKKCKKAAVIGGGLLGLEAAKGLMDLGLETHVIEFAARLMPNQLDNPASALLLETLNDMGLTCHVNKNTQEIGCDELGNVSKIIFSDETELEVDMIVVSAGIKPRDELAKQFGLETGKRGGIVVDDHMQTSVKDIYAIGECALHNSRIYGLVAPGYDMASVAVKQIIGKEAKYHGDEMMSTNLKLVGVQVASFGDAFGRNHECKSIEYHDKHTGIYKRINITNDGRRLVGGILVGDAKDFNMLLQTVNNKIELTGSPEELIFGSRTVGSASSKIGVSALPPEAIICSCENVSKHKITKAISDNNLTDIKSVQQCTKAGSGCGGCKPMIQDLLDETLKSAGKEVKKVICEHFSYSRSELYEIIKDSNIKNYNELLAEYGIGHGCEICKPVVASLMASIWNEAILSQNTIQDTNDKYLANIQRGGTYSVIPRIAGGEADPEKLEVLAKVARKYNLYVKITGAQRIGLYGAEIHQLPLIWAELIEAGMESGHAYGKALRAVKSCVGSAWCRFGMQDSTTLAIDIENRYKGLRSPHKIKMAVSGCTRECAEAIGKDIGIIATDKGWNLYVGGNGGTSPQHAKLFASDIDTEMVFKYIDRIYMYYIKSAEPLQRIAPWLNKLDGGIEHLKEVVIEDSLGLNALFEKDMQKIVDSYECEWNNAVNDKEKKKEFVHFINSDQGDPSIQFRRMRGQKFPESWS